MAPPNLYEFIQDLMMYGLEYFRRYYGPYKARVVDNADPEARGRIRVECIRANLSPNNDVWALPMATGGRNQGGVFWPPEIGDYVWIFFENGDPTMPLSYMGGWYAKGELHPDVAPEAKASPQKKGLRTPSGHSVVISDNSDDGYVTISHRSGTVVRMTNSGKIQIGKGDGSFEPMLRGSTVKRYLETHTHPHPWGPTGTSIQPFPANGLSEDSETS